MGYPVYPEMRDSGVPWLEEIPSHWQLKRLKDIASHNDETLEENTEPDFELEYVDISSVNLVDGITRTETMAFEKSPSRARRIARDGDTIISTVRTYLKAIAAIKDAPDNLVVSTGFAVIRPQAVLAPAFLSYFLQTSGFVGDVVAHSNGVSYPAINPSDLVRLPAIEPPLPEQQTIARFLDHKTAQIDALIAKKEALLQKLAEKRTALISQAVTQGLDPTVPMQDSGVAWLGQIPAHWKVMRLRFLVEKIEQGWSPQCENQAAEANEWGVLKVGCVNGEYFDESENKALPPNLEVRTQYEIQAGDILMSRANTKELLGSAAIAISPRNKLLLCDKLYRLIPSSRIDSNYLVRILRSTISRMQYERDATGTSGSMQNIGQDTIKNLVIPAPPLEEQKLIEQNLSALLTASSASEEKTQSAIEKLKEYRAALITAAVTGKIDVRGVPLPAEVSP